MEERDLLEEGRRRLPAKPTRPALLYMGESLRIFEFELFVREGALAILENLPVITSTLLTRAQSSAEARAFVDAVGRDRLPQFFNPQRHDPVFTELLLCRCVDNFLLYLAELLREIFRTRPEILRSGDQERLDFILQYESMEELTEALAERKVQRLAFLGIAQLNEFFSDRLGLTFGSEEGQKVISEAVEIRNLIVHNRGVISALFKKRLPTYPLNVGERVNLSYQVFRTYSNSLQEAVRDLDAAAAKKFGLLVAEAPQMGSGSPNA